MSPTFDRCNLDELPWTSVVAHGGEGQIRFHRIVDEAATSGACHFIDLAELPPGASIVSIPRPAAAGANRSFRTRTAFTPETGSAARGRLVFKISS